MSAAARGSRRTAAARRRPAHLSRRDRAHRHRRDGRHRPRRAGGRPDAEDFVLTHRRHAAACVSAQFIKQDPPGPPPTIAGRKLPFSTNESARRRTPRPDRLRPRGHRGRRRPRRDAGRVALSRSARRRRPRRRPRVPQRRQRRLHDRSREGEADLDGAWWAAGPSSPTGSTTSACRRRSTSTAATSARSSGSSQRECVNERTPEGVEICRTSLESQARSMAMVKSSAP